MIYKLDTKLATPKGVQIDSLSELATDETGVFAYHGRKVVLFIPDHGYGNSFDQVKNGDLNVGKKYILPNVRHLMIWLTMVG